MDNILLVFIFGVLTLYYYSSMNVYKSMYKKIKEEKDIVNHAHDNRAVELKKLEQSFNEALDTIHNSDATLTKVRDELQQIKLRNNELKHRNELLQKRVNELYSSVGMI
jgi:peptidoglycan hydrolase CwlO-like protein